MNRQLFSEFKFLLKAISRKRRLQLLALIFLIFLSSISELLSASAILPLLAVFTDSSSAWNIPYIQRLAQLAGYQPNENLLTPIFLAFVSIIFLSTLTRLLSLYLSGSLSALIGNDISNNVFSNVLSQDYECHVSRNSSQVISALTTSASRFVGAFNCVLQLLTSFLISVFLVIGMLMVSGKIALIAFLLFSSVYISIACIAKKGISQNSLLILRNNQKLTQLIQEALGSYRDIVIDNSSKIFLAIHKRIDLQARQKEISNQFSAYFPRYVVEGIGFLFIAFIGFWFNMNGDELKNALPTLGFLALASQKLLPSLQSIYSSWALIRGYDKDISILVNLALQSSSPVRDALTQFYGFSESITFQDISFKYQDSSKYALQSINLTIKSGEFVALTGSSGSGKSTLVDILMGLLRPSRGSIIVDSKTILVDEVRPILSGWMKLISHVPQSIYIKDATIAENVAFYDSLDQIDFKHLTHVCRCAEISEYIESLPQRYNSRIGEGGAKLSGGQRQRIGIARALYKNTPLLILDEATSALDRSTEHKILANIANIRPKPTIIMVTHRESTYIFCDKIVTMKGGNVYNA